MTFLAFSFFQLDQVNKLKKYNHLYKFLKEKDRFEKV